MNRVASVDEAWAPRRDDFGPGSAALAHIRVCDFSGQLAGAGATRFLAAFGAQVIRVEDPANQGRWDILRGSPPYKDDRRGINLGGCFNNHNVEKLGITLNLRTDRGRELARSLIAVSDVVTENFAAGVFARMGFSYDELCAIREDIVYVSNCGFGHTGPYSSYKTWGPIVQALCGLTFTSALADEPPAGWGYSYMDHMGGNFMALAVLAALVARDRTGSGQWIDMSCTEAGLTLSGPSLLDYTVNSRSARRPGSPDSNHDEAHQLAPHGIYPTAGEDNWIAIACRSDAEWQRLGAFIDQPWSRADELALAADRLSGQPQLDARLAQWTRPHDKFELAGPLRSLGIPAAAVSKPAERIDYDDQTRSWGLWPTVVHPEIGAVRVDGVPVHMSESDWAIERPGPCLGQHNEEVLTGLLGVSPDELPALAEAGVI